MHTQYRMQVLLCASPPPALTFFHFRDGPECVLVRTFGGPVVSLADTTRHHALRAQLLQWIVVVVLQLLRIANNKIYHVYIDS